MAKTDFLGASYRSRSLPLAAQSLVNLLFEPAPPGSAEEGLFYGTPGLALFATVGAGPIRGAHTAGGYTWFVSGGQLYRVSDAGASVLVASIPGTGRCGMAHNDTQLIVMHSTGWTVVWLGSMAVSTPANAPLTAQGAYFNSYVLFPNANGTFGWCNIADATKISALDFASAEAQPDPVISVLTDHDEAWFFGTTTTQIGRISGNADNIITMTAQLEHGCAAKYSPAKADNTVFWLGQDENGRGVVFRADGYSPSRISTYALELAIESYADISNAWGYCFQQSGHTFYVLTFDEATWLYDIGTQRWTQWAYRDPASGDIERHRANAYAFLGGKHLVGDYANGNLYRLDLDTYTDNGASIYWERAWAVIESEKVMIRHNRLEILAEMGVGLSAGGDPTILLSWSDDGCRTWSNDRELKLGAIGRYRNRAIARRLGLSRSRVYRIRGADPVKRAFYGANLDAAPGSR